MALMPDYMKLTPEEEAELAEIRRVARVRHEEARKAAYRHGRISFPDLPFECSAAYEADFLRERRPPSYIRDSVIIDAVKRVNNGTLMFLDAAGHVIQAPPAKEQYAVFQFVQEQMKNYRQVRV